MLKKIILDWQQCYINLIETELAGKFCMAYMQDNIKKLRKLTTGIQKNIKVDLKSEFTSDAKIHNLINLKNSMFELDQLQTNTTYPHVAFNPAQVALNCIHLMENICKQKQINFDIVQIPHCQMVLGNETIFTQLIFYFLNYIYKHCDKRTVNVSVNTKLKSKQKRTFILEFTVQEYLAKPDLLKKLRQPLFDFEKLVGLYGEEKARIYVVDCLTKLLKGKFQIQTRDNSTQFIFSIDFENQAIRLPRIQILPNENEDPFIINQPVTPDIPETNIATTKVSFFNNATETETDHIEENTKLASQNPKRDSKIVPKLPGQVDLHGQSNLHNQINQHGQIDQYGQLNRHGQLNQHGQSHQHGAVNQFGQLDIQPENRSKKILKKA